MWESKIQRKKETKNFPRKEWEQKKEITKKRERERERERDNKGKNNSNKKSLLGEGMN